MRPTYKQRDCCFAISRFRFETLLSLSDEQLSPLYRSKAAPID
jgi:hypothetical protein